MPERQGDPMPRSTITFNRTRFIDEFMVDGNARRAALAAGYSASSAHANAYRLLSKPDIKAAIAARQAERARMTAITADRVLAELARAAFANMADFVQAGEQGEEFVAVSKLTRDQAAAIAEVRIEGGRTKVRLIDKLEALNAIARILGFFRSGAETAPICDIDYFEPKLVSPPARDR
jgi:phage terminase small subunit